MGVRERQGKRERERKREGERAIDGELTTCSSSGEEVRSAQLHPLRTVSVKGRVRWYLVLGRRRGEGERERGRGERERREGSGC